MRTFSSELASNLFLRSETLRTRWEAHSGAGGWLLSLIVMGVMAVALAVSYQLGSSILLQGIRFLFGVLLAVYLIGRPRLLVISLIVLLQFSADFPAPLASLGPLDLRIIDFVILGGILALVGKGGVSLPVPSFFSRALLAFLVASLASLVFAAPLFGVREWAVQAVALAKFWEYLLVFVLVVSLVRSGEHLIVALRLLAVCALGQGLFALGQVGWVKLGFGFAEPFFTNSYVGPAFRATGLVGDPAGLVHYAIFLVPLMGALFVLEKDRRLKALWAVAAALLLGVSVLTYARGPQIALITALMVLIAALPGARRALLVAVPVVGLSLAFNHDVLISRWSAALSQAGGTDSSLLRLDLWVLYLQLIQQHPVWGIGWMGSQFAANLVAVTDFHTVTGPGGQISVLPVVLGAGAHNQFLQVMAETGIVGLVTFVALLAAGLRLAWVLSRGPADEGARTLGRAVFASLCGLFVAFQFNTVFFGGDPTLGMFWLSLGLVAVSRAVSPGSSQPEEDRDGALKVFAGLPGRFAHGATRKLFFALVRLQAWREQGSLLRGQRVEELKSLEAKVWGSTIPASGLVVGLVGSGATAVPVMKSVTQSSGVRPVRRSGGDRENGYQESRSEDLPVVDRPRARRSKSERASIGWIGWIGLVSALAALLSSLATLVLALVVLSMYEIVEKKDSSPHASSAMEQDRKAPGADALESVFPETRSSVPGKPGTVDRRRDSGGGKPIVNGSGLAASDAQTRDTRMLPVGKATVYRLNEEWPSHGTVELRVHTPHVFPVFSTLFATAYSREVERNTGRNYLAVYFFSPDPKSWITVYARAVGPQGEVCTVGWPLKPASAYAGRRLNLAMAWGRGHLRLYVDGEMRGIQSCRIPTEVGPDFGIAGGVDEGRVSAIFAVDEARISKGVRSGREIGDMAGTSHRWTADRQTVFLRHFEGSPQWDALRDESKLFRGW